MGGSRSTIWLFRFNRITWECLSVWQQIYYQLMFSVRGRKIRSLDWIDTVLLFWWQWQIDWLEVKLIFARFVIEFMFGDHFKVLVFVVKWLENDNYFLQVTKPLSSPFHQKTFSLSFGIGMKIFFVIFYLIFSQLSHSIFISSLSHSHPKRDQHWKPSKCNLCLLINSKTDGWQAKIVEKLLLNATTRMKLRKIFFSSIVVD